ncbi:CrcB protein [Desulfonatronum thiosulfatophilum]|uniref:Fluoride-specific ion channel FluC n=1 Tax=Desulfonatronum thiosulfatophilum TaxID=617002 RepID=A0A1G6DPF9_9BACT|nr:fluoride efflux transporter CrcB [Desulfonatronum thiosulfatophilum]SDB47087.1 CrcB protein [Desulfonatronum thiosulfatophilum]
MLFRFPEALKVILLIGLCGALGALARYWLSLAVYTFLGRNFPWGTSAVNILGCFLFGLVWVLSEERGLIPLQLRFILLVGFMGSFTTFSTYIFESTVLLEQAQWFKLGLNLLGQNILGFTALYLGFLAGRGW